LFDLAIHGRFYAEGLTSGWVYVKKGKIAKVSRERLEKAEAEITLSDSQFLLPAATDLHVHLRDWSQAKKETVESGTKSAVAGGVTTVADMPNTDPVLGSAGAVERRVELLRANGFADFAIHAGAPASPKEVAALRRAGAFALKLYPPDLGRLPEMLKEASRARMKVAVHAEEHALVGTGAASYAEGVAIRKILQQLGTSSEVRFAHVSTFDGASELVRSKPFHRRLTAEVTPHHLFMSDGVADDRIGVTSRVNPSMRSASNSLKMRRMMRQGAFEFYATDHAPHTVEEKFQGAPGFPALEFALPLFLTKTRDVALVTRMYCEAPAAYLGIRKGKISAGYLADLVIIGRRDWKIDPEKFVSKARVTPFAGEVMRYAVDHVFKGGSTVYQGGRFRRVAPKLVAPAQLH
jgi:dihydroorotase